jgi:hypothetical protein
MKVLILLYGIMRGNKESIGSINSKLIQPLINTNNNVDVYHFVHSIKDIKNPRSNEYGELNQPDSSPFLNAILFKYETTDLQHKSDERIINSTKDIYLDDFKSIKNLLFQLSLLKKSTYKVDYEKYDVVFLTRDDLLFNKTPDFHLELEIYRKNIYFSIWGWHGGLSDRFVAGPAVKIKELARRYDNIYSFLKKNEYLHPESLVLFSLKSTQTVFLASNFKFIRCRLNNKLVKENFLFPFWRPTESLRIFVSYVRYIVSRIL